MHKVLKKGESGYFVDKWQEFLRGQGYLLDVTGLFDEDTRKATVAFQKKYKLEPDGIVGNKTLAKAMSLGFELVEYAESTAGFPPKPGFPPLMNTAARQKLFGPLEYKPAPTKDNPEKIAITNGWDKTNIVSVQIPQLTGITGAPKGNLVRFHRKAADQLVGLWGAWEKRKLLHLVLSYSGDFVPRFVRGKAAQQILSNHAFGTAFDINYAWNKLGAEPTVDGKKGSVYRLVSVAHEYGFYWGGHFTRRDGMHFEVAQLK